MSAPLGFQGVGAGFKKGVGPLTELYIKNGGGFETLTRQGMLFKKGAFQLPRKGRLGKAKDVTQDVLQKTQVVLGSLGQYSEMITRMALMRRIMDIELPGKGDVIKRLEALKQTKNGSEKADNVVRKAVWTARTNIDFAQGGSLTKSYDKISPYLNAAVQGTRGLVQAFGLEESFAGNKKKAQQMRNRASIMTPQIMLAGFLPMYWRLWRGQDDEEEKERIFEPSAKERESGWVIPLPRTFYFTDKEGNRRGTWLKIQKDQGQRLFSTLGEQAAVATARAQGWHKEDVDLGQIGQALMEYVAVSPVPPLVEAIFAYSMNFDVWRQREIWQGMQVNPKDEVYADTPKSFQVIGETLGASPARMNVALKKLIPPNIWTAMSGYGIDQTFQLLSDDEKFDISSTWQEAVAGSATGQSFKPTAILYIQLS